MRFTQAAECKLLYLTVQNKANAEVISWTNNGRAFAIKDKQVFAKTLLPQLVKHNSFPSFVRQLIRYRFKKLVRTSGYFFYRPDFQKDSAATLVNMLPLRAPEKPLASAEQLGHTSQESTIELSQEPICDLLKSCHSQTQGLSQYTKSLQALRENLLKSLVPNNPGLLVELDGVAISSEG